MKILWQTFSNPENESPYGEQLVQYVSELAGTGVQFDFIGLDPPDVHIHRITELRAGAQVVANLIEAENEGYDAAVIGHFQDPGLWDARAAVDIPVLGLGETSLLYSCMFGRRVGLVTISPIFTHWHEEQIHQYHLDGRVAGVAAMETDVASFVAAFDGDTSVYADIRNQFEESARGLVAAGAEVVIPAGGLPALLFQEEQFDLNGATVLNPVLVLAKQGEVAGSVRALDGFGTGRSSTFARASAKARAEFVDQLGGHGRKFSAPSSPAD